MLVFFLLFSVWTGVENTQIKLKFI